MVTVVDVHVTAGSALGLAPMLVRREGDLFLIGRRGGGSYLALSEDAMRVVEWIRAGRTIDDIKRRLKEEFPEDDVKLHDLIETIAAAGLIAEVGGQPLASSPARRVPALARLRREQVAWLFTPWLAGLYVLVITAGAVLLWANPSYLPAPGTVVLMGSYALTSLIGFLMLAVMVAKHEAAHVIAGRFVGVDAYCRLSHRLYFPVIEADLTDLWMVGRRERLIACSAGMVSDLLVGALAVIALSLADYTAVVLGADWVAAIKLLLLIALTSVLFQFNVFLRTDVYYMLATALDARNLSADAKRYLAGVLRRRPPAPSRWYVRAYAIGAVVITTLLVVLGAAYLATAVAFIASGRANFATPPAATGMSGRLVTAASVLLLIGMLAASMWSGRRSARIEYRLRAPADL